MSFSSVVTNLVSIISGYAIPLVFSIAFLAFFWGVVQYFFLGGDNQESRAQGRTFILWAVIAMAVMFSAWGLVKTLLGTFGIQ